MLILNFGMEIGNTGMCDGGEAAFRTVRPGSIPFAPFVHGVYFGWGGMRFTLICGYCEVLPAVVTLPLEMCADLIVRLAWFSPASFTHATRFSR